MTSKFAVIVFLVGIVASVAGFVSCAALDLNCKQVKQSLRGATSAAWCSIYNWGMIFFAGTALISVAWAMGERSPVVFVSPFEADNKIQFGSVFSIWLFVCCAGLATQRAFKILRHPKGAISMRTMLVLFCSVFLLAGCTSITAPNTYVAAHERLYKAKVPYLQRYASEHPADKPAIDDNVAQEGELIDAAKKGNFPGN